MQKFKKTNDNEVLIPAFDFLTDFLTNNYGSDIQIQFTSYVIPEVLDICIICDNQTLESAEEILNAYIRTSKHLENVLDLLTSKHIKSYDEEQESDAIWKSIDLAIKNIEYHPKVISAKSKSFIEFIEWLLNLAFKDNKEVSKKANSVLMNFIKRFPATIKEISNEFESRDISELSQLIKQRNDSLSQK